MVDALRKLLIDIGLPESQYLVWVVLGVAVIVQAMLANYLAKRILLRGVTFFIKRTRTEWDDALLKNKVFSRLAHLAPAMVIYF